MSDREFVEHLKSLEGRPPDLQVDRAQVLARGRRRRVARAVRLTAGTGIVVGAVAVGALALRPAPPVTVVPGGPGTPSAIASARADGERPVVVDVERREVAYPMDDWELTPVERVVAATAQADFRARCLDDAGYSAELRNADLDPTVYESEREDTEFGLWRAAELEQAYSGLRVDPTAAVPIPSVESDALGPARAQCFEAAAQAGLALDVGDDGASMWESRAPRGMDRAGDTAEGLATHREWAQCLHDHGIEVTITDGESPGWIPADMLGMSDAPDAPLPEQRRVARLDLDCKQDLGTIEKMVQIEARLQYEYIDRGRDYLEDRKAHEENVYNNAVRYLDERGYDVPAR
jgi:hypothetical protein